MRNGYVQDEYLFLNNNNSNVNPESNNNNNNTSYSNVLRNPPQNSNQSSFEKLESLIQNQIELTNKLLSMLTVLDRMPMGFQTIHKKLNYLLKHILLIFY